MVSSSRLVLPDVLAGVDVDGHQRLGLIDDDVAAGLEPDLGLERLLDLLLDAELFEQRRVAGVELDLADQRGLAAVHEIQHALVVDFAVHAHALEIRRQQVAQQALHEVEIAVEQRRRLQAVRLGPDLVPERGEELQVGLELFFGAALPGGAHDEAAGERALVLQDDVAQAQALLFRSDLARDANVVDGGHVDQVASRQGDVRSDARALGAERLLGDLDQDFLAFLEHFGNLHGLMVAWTRRLAAALLAARAARAATATPVARGKTRPLVGLAQSVGAVTRSATSFARGGRAGRGFLGNRLLCGHGAGRSPRGHFALGSGFRHFLGAFRNLVPPCLALDRTNLRGVRLGFGGGLLVNYLRRSGSLCVCKRGVRRSKFARILRLQQMDGGLQRDGGL